MSLILPEHLKIAKETANWNIEKYRGFNMIVVKLDNNYTTPKSIGKAVVSTLTNDNLRDELTEDIKYYGFALCESLGVELYSIGATRNLAGQRLHQKIDLLLNAYFQGDKN